MPIITGGGRVRNFRLCSLASLKPAWATRELISERREEMGEGRSRDRKMHACNSSTQARVREEAWTSKANLRYIVKPCLKSKLGC